MKKNATSKKKVVIKGTNKEKPTLRPCLPFFA